jgi:hypothetical protein
MKKEGRAIDNWGDAIDASSSDSSGEPHCILAEVELKF